MFNICHPMIGTTAAEQDACVQADKDRRWAAFTTKPNIRWMYVRDEATGRIAGAAQWVEFTEPDPFPEGPGTRIEATMWPEGPYREFAAEILRQFTTPEATWVRRPHFGAYRAASAGERHGRGVR